MFRSASSSQQPTLRLQLFRSHLLAVLFCACLLLLGNFLYVRHRFEPQISHKARTEALEVLRAIKQEWTTDRIGDEKLKQVLLEANFRSFFRFTVVQLDGTACYPIEFKLEPEQRLALSEGKECSGIFGADAVKQAPRGGPYVGLPMEDFALIAFSIRPSPQLRLSWGWIALNLLIAGMLAATLANRASARLSRPFRKLRAGAGKLAAGELSLRVEVEGIKEVSELAESFNEMARSLEKHVQSQNRLLRDVSHELATPLTALRATMEALEDGYLEKLEFAQILRESALHQLEHLSRLVEDFTELSRLETGEFQLKPSHVPARALAAEVVESHRALATKSQMELALDAEERSVWADRVRIVQVLRNLVANAVAHNPEGTRITVEGRATESEYLFKVTDNGPSIPPEDEKLIFERLFKRSKERPVGLGSGLGLAIVATLLEKHGSEIRLVQEASGKSFLFSLPLAEHPTEGRIR